MRVSTKRQKPQVSKLATFPAPTGGWISNRNLAIASSSTETPGAAVLENFFPTPTGVVLRRGNVQWVDLDDENPVLSLFTYSSGTQSQLFAATATGVWNISVSSSTPQVLSGKTGGNWSVVQFSTAGGVYLVGVNGSDEGFHYDGATFSGADSGPMGIEFPDGYDGLTTADLSYVWVYQGRIWFLQKNSLNAFYLPVGVLGGALAVYPLGAVFARGGSLLWGQSWSLSSGGSGGLSDQCVFCTTEGEVAAYQGIDPGSASDWEKVGTYRIGRPMGNKGIIKAGGDLVIATTVGFVSLGQAAQNDYAALGRLAVSYPIEDEWAKATTERGADDWRCQVWPNGQMVLVSPPTPTGGTPVTFVSNSNTGAWCKFTGWDVTATEVFNGELFFGTSDGRVCQGWTGGNDEGQPYVGRILPLYDDLGAPGSRKIAKVARVVKRSTFSSREGISARFDFDLTFPAAPSPDGIVTSNEWDNAIWDQSVWDATRGAIVTGDWRSVGGSGYDVAVAVQVTSNTSVPIDVEIIRTDLTYTVAGVVT